jgi:prepilin signal peptidase PulO-like enzyme (type II secretory pathway)
VTAWGVVAACAAGGLVAGPCLDVLARRVRRAGGGTGSPGTATLTRPAASAPAQAVPAAALSATPGPAPGPSAAPAGGGAAPVAAGPPSTAGLPFGVEGTLAGVVTAGLFVLAAVRLGAVPDLAAYCVLFAALVAVSITDLRTGLVPRWFVYPALGLVAAALVGASAADGHWRPLLDALVGGAAGFAVLGAVWWVYPKGMGFGDVRLAALCGAGLGWLGWAPVYLGFLAGFVVGALAGLAVLAARGRRRFPFAPALAVGTVFGVLWGTWLGNLWLHPG